jgi:hypothetical protein
MNYNQLATAYDPNLNACIGLDTRRDLLNTLDILLVDAILLLAMLIGLSRHPQRNPAGIWKFLYQQVILVRFHFVVHSAEFLVVYNMDSVGHVFGDSVCGRFLFRVSLTFGSRFVGLSYSESEWCVCFFRRAPVWRQADISLCDLTAAWNEVR